MHCRTILSLFKVEQTWCSRSEIALYLAFGCFLKKYWMCIWMVIRFFSEASWVAFVTNTLTWLYICLFHLWTTTLSDKRLYSPIRLMLLIDMIYGFSFFVKFIPCAHRSYWVLIFWRKWRQDSRSLFFIQFLEETASFVYQVVHIEPTSNRHFLQCLLPFFHTLLHLIFWRHLGLWIEYALSKFHIFIINPLSFLDFSTVIQRAVLLSLRDRWLSSWLPVRRAGWWRPICVFRFPLQIGIYVKKLFE